jgi:hypothetical protein
MLDCGEDCEIQTGADHPLPAGRVHPDAMKEFQPSLQLAVDNLPQAYSPLAAVCLLVDLKQTPSRLALNTASSVSNNA